MGICIVNMANRQMSLKPCFQSFRVMIRSCTAGPQGNSAFDYLRSHAADFHGGCTVFSCAMPIFKNQVVLLSFRSSFCILDVILLPIIWLLNIFPNSWATFLFWGHCLLVCKMLKFFMKPNLSTSFFDASAFGRWYLGKNPTSFFFQEYLVLTCLHHCGTCVPGLGT